MKKIDKLTDRQADVLRRGLILYRDKLEKLFSVDFMEKHKHLEYATLVLEEDGFGEYFFTLIEDLNNYLCTPDYNPIDTEFMLQDLFDCGIIRDEILVYLADIDKPHKHRLDYKNLEEGIIDSAIMQNGIVTSEEFERMVNIDEISLERYFIHIAKEGEK